MPFFGNPPVPRDGLPTPWDLTSIPPMAPEEPGYTYGSILPFRKPTAGGAAEWAVPGIARSIYNAFTAPERARTGRLDVGDPVASTYEAGNLAMNLLGANVPAGAINRPGPGQLGMLGAPGEATIEKPVGQLQVGRQFQNAYPPGGQLQAQKLISRLEHPPEAGGGGFTVDIQGNQPTQGYAVAAFPDRGLKGSNVKPGQLLDFIRANEEFLRKEGNYVGAWKDAQDKKVFLDIVNIVPDRAQAEAIGKAFGERAIYDLGAKKEIRLDYNAHEADAANQWLPLFQPKIREGYMIGKGNEPSIPVTGVPGTAEQGLRQFRLARNVGRLEEAPSTPPSPIDMGGAARIAADQAAKREPYEAGVGMTNQLGDALGETNFGWGKELAGEVSAPRKQAIIDALMRRNRAPDEPISGLGTRSLPIYAENTDRAILQANQILDKVRQPLEAPGTGGVVAQWGEGALPKPYRLEQIQPGRGVGGNLFRIIDDRGSIVDQFGARDRVQAPSVAMAKLDAAGLLPKGPQPGETIKNIPNEPGLGLPSGYNLKELQPSEAAAAGGQRRFQLGGPGIKGALDVWVPRASQALGDEPAGTAGAVNRGQELLRNMGLLKEPPAIGSEPSAVAGRGIGAPQMDLGSFNLSPFLRRPVKMHPSVFEGASGPSAIVNALRGGGLNARANLVERLAGGENIRDVLTNPGMGEQRWLAQDFLPRWDKRGLLAKGAKPEAPATQPTGPSHFALKQEPWEMPSLKSSPPVPSIVEAQSQPMIQLTQPRQKGLDPNFQLAPGEGPEVPAQANADLVKNVNKYMDALRERDYSTLPDNITMDDLDKGRPVGHGIHRPVVVKIGGKEAFAKLMNRGESPLGELASYDAQTLLGIPRVPVKVYPQPSGRAIISKSVLKDMTMIGDFNGKLDPKASMDLFAMDMLGDVRDRHYQNFMITKDGRPIGIDFDSAFGHFELNDAYRHALWSKLRSQQDKADASMFVYIVDHRDIIESRMAKTTGISDFIPHRINMIEKVVDKLKLRENPEVDLGKLEKELKRSGVRPELDGGR